MISFSLEDIEIDEDLISEMIDQAKFRGLRRFGFKTRERAMDSIRFSKSTSRAGHAPNSHTGFLRNFILYDVERGSNRVVVGPKQLNRRSSDVAKSLENGGFSRNTQGKLIRITQRPFMVPAFNRIVRQSVPAVFANTFGKDA